MKAPAEPFFYSAIREKHASGGSMSSRFNSSDDSR